MVIDQQRNTMVKTEKDCGFNSLLFHKAVSKVAIGKVFYTNTKNQQGLE
jgi:hypothetical protein